MDRHRVTIKAPHATRGKLWGIIKESAVAMLMDRAVLGSGGFREWFYSAPYRISNRALADIDYLIGTYSSSGISSGTLDGRKSSDTSPLHPFLARSTDHRWKSDRAWLDSASQRFVPSIALTRRGTCYIINSSGLNSHL